MSISLGFFKLFKVINCLTAGLSLAIDDGKITMGEIASILEQICRILDIPFHFDITDDVSKMIAAVTEER